MLLLLSSLQPMAQMEKTPSLAATETGQREQGAPRKARPLRGGIGLHPQRRHHLSSLKMASI